MLKATLRVCAARVLALLTIAAAIHTPLVGQVALPSGSTTETFDALAGGLPPGWTVYTGATLSTLGNPATVTTTAAGWSDTSGAWKNFAAADNATLVATSTTAQQSAAADRALGIRQTGSFGDPGASANFYFSTLGQQVSAISFSAQMLSVQARSTVWKLQYGLGATPAGWTDLATYSDPAVFGQTVLNASGFGTALDNQPAVWLRIVALSGSTGSGSRDSFGIDDFTIVTVPGGGPIPPSITTPPASQTVTEGATVQFTVVASGDEPLTYQWRKSTTELVDGGIVSGATTTTLTLTGVTLLDAGNYHVVVTNAAASTPSAEATLVVNPLLVAPSITAQPAPQSVVPGGTATFSVVASGTAPLAYQWWRGATALTDGGAIAGATTATLTISNVTSAELGDYSVVVSNGVPPDATSNAAALTLAAVITPAGHVSYAGGSYVQTFDTLPASGTFALTGNGPHRLAAAPINASGLGAWSFANYDGSGTAALFRVDAGTGTSGSVYSYGAAAATDRALGSLASGSTISRVGVALVNDTGRTITEFSLSYAGEQWRRGGSGNANTFAVEYAIGADSINADNFVASPALGFNSPSTTASAGALDGNAAANRASVSGTVGGFTWAPGQTLVLRWNDVNDGGSDDGLAIDDFTFSTPVGPGDIIPAVSYLTPAADSVNVAPNSTITVAFNEPVSVIGDWFTLTGELSGAHAAVVSGGPVSYVLTPVVPFAEGEVVTVTVLATGITDAATGTKHPSADYRAQLITSSTGPLPIHLIQGRGLKSAFAGYSVSVRGVVVASFQGLTGIGGYFVEAPAAAHDSDAETSEGIYVFDNTNLVNVGDLVTVTGTVTEYGSAPDSETEITNVTAFAKENSGQPLPAAAEVSLPFASATYPERYEGMLVTFPQTLTVTDNYDLGHYGEVILSNGRLQQPTNIVAPGAAAQAQAAANALNQVLLDDGLSVTYPAPTPYLSSSDPATATRRAGSTTAGVTGALSNRFGTYVLEPTLVPTFVDANPRAGVPARLGGLRIVGGNVENFMNGDGTGAGFPTSRGASSYAEYERQLAKVTAAILALAPDIMGLTEIENDRVTNGATDSYGPTSAIAQLVDSLNAHAPAGVTYAFVNAAAVDIVTDQVRSALIYRTETVETVGQPAMLNNVYFNNHARNPLAQTFRQKSTGGMLTVSVNHFRAKASASSLTDGISPNPNNDLGDGQGTNNYLRTKEAEALVQWLATDPTGSGDPDYLIIGDLNSYAQEDPIAVIENAGYLNLAEKFEGADGYSYSFDGQFGHLDHALASPSLVAQVLGTATWHANSDEPVYYDYNVEDKDANQQAINATTMFRYSDHDPVVIDADLFAAPTILTEPEPQTVIVGSSVTLSITVTGTPAPTFQWRKNGAPIPNATGASYTLANPVVADSGAYDVVVTNALGSVTSATVSLTINPAPATLSLSGLEQRYDGTPRAVTASTAPAGLNVAITYNGSATPPVYPGAYAVVATIQDPDYVGSAEDVLVISTTALVRHAPTVNGGIDGSIQMLLPESVTLNSNAWISGDLLMPGMPSVRKNGNPTFGGTIEANGSATPTNHTLTLNSKAVLRHLVRRVDAVAMPTVDAPPSPTGTRNVQVNSASQVPTDFSTVRDLTLNSNAGIVAVPPGTYGSFTANGSSRFRFGVAGATTPAVYNLQRLTINSNTRIEIVGPVILTLANGSSLNGNIGTGDHPEWLELKIANGGLTLNGNVSFHGSVTAPNGAVTVNGNSTLVGGVVADRLTINGNGLIK